MPEIWTIMENKKDEKKVLKKLKSTLQLRRKNSTIF